MREIHTEPVECCVGVHILHMCYGFKVFLISKLLVSICDVYTERTNKLEM